MRQLTWIALVISGAAIASAAQRPDAPPSVPELVARAGDRVQEWYSRAQSIVSREDVSIQSLRADLTPVNFARRLTYELRVAWDPDEAVPGTLPQARVMRQILTTNGRTPRPKDTPGCTDPKPVSEEPLAMLLPARRAEYTFSAAGSTRVDGRPSLMLDYRSAAAGPADIQWKDECVSVSLPGRTRGRIWIDAVTSDVLRLDEHLVGLFEFRVPFEQVRHGAAPLMVIERADSAIQYRRVQFQDPEETLVLPAAIETITVFRGGGVQTTRTTHRFSDYRRFLTGGRLIR